MTDAERNPLKGRTGSNCLPIPIIHGTAREGIAAVPQNLPILQREALMKTANGEEERWPTVAHSVFWAERITVLKSTGKSPYFMAHGVEPLLPFDISEATYLLGPLDSPMTEAQLLEIRAR